jgi:FK506-binding nuclear protein
MQHYQQTLDLVFSPDEEVIFMVTGTHSVYLTGNYIVPADEGSDDDDEDYGYDLPMDEDELELSDEDDESDELDGLDNPRITEIDSEDEAPKLVKATKGKNKRAADSDDESGNLDDIMAKALKTGDGEAKLSKKQQKKLKKNNGEAAPAEAKADAAAPSKSDKKVQFAKNLEQGPTPSPQDKKGKDGQAGTLGPKEVKGVKIDDKKLGKGRQAKAGDQVSMRYIGKLDSGKVFDGMLSGFRWFRARQN